ncbi:uncharacterized protein [Anabrus simplex]|uniref:uncharacterized protein n=1 Tax=Anabrus simplex TaxID=316456 RepID=UPI0035A2816D
MDSPINNAGGNDSSVKVEPQTSIVPKTENDALAPGFEDDVTMGPSVNKTAGNDSRPTVKVEPQTSIIPKVENDALDPGNEDDITVPFAEDKDKAFIGEHTVELVPCFKDESNFAAKSWKCLNLWERAPGFNLATPRNPIARHGHSKARKWNQNMPTNTMPGDGRWGLPSGLVTWKINQLEQQT